MNFKNFITLIIFTTFLGFCNNEVSTPENNLNDCIKNVLSPTDYEKFLNNEITLEPYEDLIQNCMNGNLVATTLSLEKDESPTTSVDLSPASTTKVLDSKKLRGFTEDAITASEKWPIVYSFGEIIDSSTKHNVSKTTALIESSKVETIQMIFSNCESNEVKFSNVVLQQKEEVEFINKDCRKGISLNSFKYLIVKNLNHEIALYGDGSFINLKSEERGCCHTLNLLNLISEHTKNINSFF